MSMRTADLVSEWETVSFEGGYDGLHSLADREFSGVVTAGPARLFMLRGTVVGILDGDIEQFEDGGGTAREAPHDALPLLTVMQARAGDPRAQYYTEDTPLSEVDGTLSDGGFTGFVELSENVLSGDYYLIYHQGRSMTVAWVGSSQRLLTDDEAFEQANDEVGIYDVYQVDIEPIELPDVPDEDGVADDTADDSETDLSDLTSATETSTSDDTGGTDPSEDTGSETDISEDVDPDSEDWFDGDPTTSDGVSEAAPPGMEQVSPVEAEPEGDKQDPAETDDDTPAPAMDADTQSEAQATEESPESVATESDIEATEADIDVSETDSDVTEPESPETDPSAQDSPPTPEPDPSRNSEPTAATTVEAEDSAASATLEIRSIPSLDPERSQSNTSQSDSMAQPTTTRTQPESESTAQPSEPTTSSESDASADSETSSDAEPSQLKQELAERENKIQRLQTELDELKAENEDLKSERGRLREELEEARAEIQRLKTELDDVSAPTGGVQLSATEAIDETNLFVRYQSKSGATLEKAKDGSVERSAVEENLRLEHHTQFEDGSATVDGQEFEAFLHDTIQYRFVKWLIHNLLYEIRDTGHAGSMSVLYNALPKIDRAELNGSVSVTYTENGEQHRTQEEFDVVVRDRMGNPLIVANINDSRQPATGGQMRNIVQDAENVGNTSDSLAAAFLVTNSFFEPEALETAEEATASGLLSRDKGKSFVNLSRKDGYHLCLLEARNDEFHLAVPEL